MLGFSSDCHTPGCPNTFSLKSSVLKFVPWMSQEPALCILVKFKFNLNLISIFNLHRPLGSFEGIIPDMEASKTSFQMRKLRKCNSKRRSFEYVIPNNCYIVYLI